MNTGVKIKLSRVGEKFVADERDPYCVVVSRVPCAGEYIWDPWGGPTGGGHGPERLIGRYKVLHVMLYALKGRGDELAATVYVEEAPEGG